MNSMTTRIALRPLAIGLLTISLLSGCASMSKQDKNTAIGAAAGAVLGSVLTDGSTVGTLGGAAVGGVIGNQTGKRR